MERRNPKPPTWRNWRTLMACVLGLICLMSIPFTRAVIVWMLPLGSGMDDLVFFALVLAAAVLLLIRAAPMKDKLKAFAHWISK